MRQRQESGDLLHEVGHDVARHGRAGQEEHGVEDSHPNCLGRSGGGHDAGQDESYGEETKGAQQGGRNDSQIAVGDTQVEDGQAGNEEQDGACGRHHNLRCHLRPQHRTGTQGRCAQPPQNAQVTIIGQRGGNAQHADGADDHTDVTGDRQIYPAVAAEQLVGFVAEDEAKQHHYHYRKGEGEKECQRLAEL